MVRADAPIVSCAWCRKDTTLETARAHVRDVGGSTVEQLVFLLPDQWREASASPLSKNRFACSAACCGRVLAVFTILPEQGGEACSFDQLRDACLRALNGSRP